MRPLAFLRNDSVLATQLSLLGWLEAGETCRLFVTVCLQAASNSNVVIFAEVNFSMNDSSVHQTDRLASGVLVPDCTMAFEY